MPNDYFQFKNFIIEQDKCAMKVGTDGVLLGAWVNVNSVKRALDVGTGTGLIAIMLAQRSDAIIDAIEIEKVAAKQAKENTLNCPWKNRINLYPISLQEFIRKKKDDYDLIVSNPPFFTNSYTNTDSGRKLARHDDMLNMDYLFSVTTGLLSGNGRLAIIYPSDMLNTIRRKAADCNLRLIRLTEVFPTPEKKSNRILAEFSFQQGSVEKNKIIIEDHGRHKYSKEYIEMTNDFYLNF
jgi:tRNA1Val (adenine37-N6)-methyltransferase